MRRQNITFATYRLLTFLAFAALVWVNSSARLNASTSDIAALCDQAALSASQTEDVPFDILRAITRTETGRTLDGILQPWPWATNAAGQGDWFETDEAALRHIEAIVASGRRNVDVGCFQLNHRWHAEAFPSLRTMIEPVANARYAAQFLRRLHDEFGDWDAAVAAYHSRTPTYATRYLARFHDIRAALPMALAHSPPEVRPRITGPSPLDFSTRLSLAALGQGLNTRGAAPLLANRTAQPLFGGRP